MGPTSRLTSPSSKSTRKEPRYQLSLHALSLLLPILKPSRTFPAHPTMLLCWLSWRKLLSVTWIVLIQCVSHPLRLISMPIYLEKERPSLMKLLEWPSLMQWLLPLTLIQEALVEFLPRPTWTPLICMPISDGQSDNHRLIS